MARPELNVNHLVMARVFDPPDAGAELDRYGSDEHCGAIGGVPMTFIVATSTIGQAERIAEGMHVFAELAVSSWTAICERRLLGDWFVAQQTAQAAFSEAGVGE